MTREPTATIVVVCRDRWSLRSRRSTPCSPGPTRATKSWSSTPARRAVGAAFDRLAAVGRIRLIRRPRFLAGNEARNVGADAVRTDWIVFVENDVVPSDGWLDALLAVGQRAGAASVYPAYLEPRARHRGSTASDPIELGGPDGRRFLHEHQYELLGLLVLGVVIAALVAALAAMTLTRRIPTAALLRDE